MTNKILGKREQNAAEIKDRLYVAAASVVGRVGFRNASISRITNEAGVAQGTFYNYFESREAIFAELVLIFGKRMRTHIWKRVSHIDDFFERERTAFEAFFEFTRDNPFFIRILRESEILIPDSYRIYFNEVLTGYSKELKQSMRSGQIRRMPRQEAEAIALVLMSARNYFSYHYSSKTSRGSLIPKAGINAYMNIVIGALTPIGSPDLTISRSSAIRPD